MPSTRQQSDRHAAMRAVGWLDPAEAEKLRREIDKTRETLAIVIDQYAAAEHEREAERPVIDAARALVVWYRSDSEDPAPFGLVAAAVDALDAQPATEADPPPGATTSYVQWGWLLPGESRWTVGPSESRARHVVGTSAPTGTKLGRRYVSMWEEVANPVDAQPTDRHPESYCHRCGGPNFTWSAPSPLWNHVMRGGSIDGPWQWDEIICPVCFVQLAEAAGMASSWRLYAERVNVELETVTPSGRAWNPDTWLWGDPVDAQASNEDVQP